MTSISVLYDQREFDQTQAGERRYINEIEKSDTSASLNIHCSCLMRRMGKWSIKIGCRRKIKIQRNSSVSVARVKRQTHCLRSLLAPKAAWSTVVVDGPVVALKRSPFFKDVILVAGGWMFQIWREKVHVSETFLSNHFSDMSVVREVLRSTDHFLMRHDTSKQKKKNLIIMSSSNDFVFLVGLSLAHGALEREDHRCRMVSDSTGCLLHIEAEW